MFASGIETPAETVPTYTQVIHVSYALKGTATILYNILEHHQAMPVSPNPAILSSLVYNASIRLICSRNHRRRNTPNLNPVILCRFSSPYFLCNKCFVSYPVNFGNGVLMDLPVIPHIHNQMGLRRDKRGVGKTPNRVASVLCMVGIGCATWELGRLMGSNEAARMVAVASTKHEGTGGST